MKWVPLNSLARTIPNPVSRRLDLVACVCLAAITWLVFAQTLTYDFVNFDDAEYVYRNAQVRSGLSMTGIASAFIHPHAGNWHPLTTISHMTDCQLFGVNPGAHHGVNVLLHTVSVILLFFVLREMTGTLWRSAFVAAIFAIHPLHVESVAWIAERKDVLSGVFFMLTLGAYTRYTRSPSGLGYFTVALLLALGLMCKPMLVTVPLVLLLLDYWPLGRVVDFATFKKVVLEKLPFLGLSLASSWATLLAQKATLSPFEKLSVLLRIENALVVYAAYVGQMIWPIQLTPYYQHPGNRLPTWHLLVAGLVLVGISALVFASRRKQPYLLVGWMWYVIMLLPVIGIVQVGLQGHADRYTYLPHIGLYVSIAWAATDWSSSWRYRQEMLGAVAVLIIALFALAARKQTSYWRNGESLWTRVVTVDPSNGFGYFGLGEALLGQNCVEEGIARLQMAVVKWPWFSPSHFQLAGALAKVGEREGAIAQYQKVISLGSPTAAVYYSLGMLLSEKGEAEEAIAQYQEAMKVEPSKPEAETALANVLLERGRFEEAIGHYENLVQRYPQDAMAHYNLAVGLHRQGRLNEAISHYRQTLLIQPNYPDAHYNLGNALLQNGQFDESRAHLEAAKVSH